MTSKNDNEETSRIKLLEKRLERERKARHSAEAIAEEGLRELYQKNKQLELLNAIALSITESDGIEEIFHAVLRQIGTYLEFKAGRVCPLNPGIKSLLKSPIWYGSEAYSFYDAFRQKMDQDLALSGILSSESEAPISIRPTADLDNATLRELFAHYEIDNYLAVPVIINDHIALTLYFFGSKQKTQTSETDKLLRQIAAQLGVHLERELIRAQARIDISRDLLTGLANRRYIYETIDRILIGNQNNVMPKTSILVVGFDNFRHLNDTFGHDLGDRIIQEASRRIIEMIKILPDNATATVGRVAGDEFAIILEDLADTDTVEQEAAKILQSLSMPYQSFDHPFPCTASGGLVHFNHATKTSFQVFSDVDTALQYAKQKGGANLTVFGDAMRQMTYRRRIMAANVNRGLSQDEFVLHYQPLISVADQSLIGFESLIRWRNADGTLITPIEFLPIADQSGLTIPIGQWVLKNGLKAIGRWGNVLKDYPRFKLGINISPSHFMATDFGDECLNLLNENEVSTDKICVEIVESTILENNPIVLKNFDFLRKNGIAIAIDDFGTGYSSLSYLQKYKPDTIKIDKEFITNISNNSESQKIVTAIIELAEKLDVSVIAEGVETKEDFLFLSRLGCEFAQGYYFSKPVSEADASQMLHGISNKWANRNAVN